MKPYFLFLSIPVLLLSRSEEHTSELQSLRHLVCRLLLEKKQPSGAVGVRGLAAVCGRCFFSISAGGASVCPEVILLDFKLPSRVVFEVLDRFFFNAAAAPQIFLFFPPRRSPD